MDRVVSLETHLEPERIFFFANEIVNRHPWSILTVSIRKDNKRDGCD